MSELSPGHPVSLGMRNSLKTFFYSFFLMRLDDFGALLVDALSKNETILLVCNCEITYSGRAEAFLPRGDRVVIIKSDRSVHVHQPSGVAPVNYMKPGTSVKLSGSLLKFHNIKDHEFLDVELFEVYDFFSRRLVDGAKLLLEGTEADMSDMLRDNPGLVEPGFRPLSREEHTKVGFIDVFGYDKDGNFVVVECKRYTASLDAVTQLRRYVEKVKKSKGISNVRGVLAAPSITSNALVFLEELGFKFVKVSPPKRLERFRRSQSRLDDF